jgi:hypothetical protein
MMRHCEKMSSRCWPARPTPVHSSKVQALEVAPELLTDAQHDRLVGRTIEPIGIPRWHDRRRPVARADPRLDHVRIIRAPLLRQVGPGRLRFNQRSGWSISAFWNQCFGFVAQNSASSTR